MSYFLSESSSSKHLQHAARCGASGDALQCAIGIYAIFRVEAVGRSLISA